MRTTARESGQEGQAIVEAALVLPAMVFLLLVALQLTQLQQARLMAEYAAFTAARAGIVFNGDNGASNRGTDGTMHEAAVLAVLPTFGRADSFPALAKTLARFEAQDAALRAMGLPQVRVHVLSPRRGEFAELGGHLDGEEIDFDDVRPRAADATLLSIQVRYLYELRVPFANRMLQTLWLASKVGLGRFWTGADLTSPRLLDPRGPGAVTATRAAAAALVVQDGTPEGIPVAGLLAAGKLGHYLLPVQAFTTVRMQSNPFLRWAHP